jgi:hypothetical protein
MQALTRPERHDIARSQPHSAPDRRGSAAARQRHQDHVSRHGNKGDPRQVFLAGGQPQLGQHDLGQPCPERTGPGDEQAEAAFRAHGSREIVGFAEHRGNAARYSRRPLPVPPRVRGLLGAWLFNFGRNSGGRRETSGPLLLRQ